MILTRNFLSLAVLAIGATPCMGQFQLQCFGGRALDCSQFITPFCNGLTADGPVASGDIVSRCFNVFNGLRCDLTALNTGANATTSAAANCSTAMKAVSGGCPSDGSATFSNSFYFQLDPNTGRCAIPGGN
ncbi:TMV resistance protein Y3 [Mycena belliarum]|uniref:TMV resistance protein Y3 n=1 Tax=Mycena belliarum TaxID=1033014 RepID=A0AAD6U1T2_9AGAR|nr:TMV resistance protein Y3 [Mycena belliae]